MSLDPPIPVYVINFNHEERKQRMLDRFHHFGIEPIFTPAVTLDDPRLEKTPQHLKRIWAIMLQHLDSLRDFYENQPTATRCIVCEDDIYLAKDFINDLIPVVEQFDKLELDLLMLGCLLPFKIDMNTCLHREYFPILNQSEKYAIHKFPNDLWGTQMYMSSKPYAKYLLETFTVEYALAHMETFTYSSDWVVTKNGKRAMVYPMIAVEEGVNLSDHYGQIQYHRICHAVNFDPAKYM